MSGNRCYYCIIKLIKSKLLPTVDIKNTPIPLPPAINSDVYASKTWSLTIKVIRKS